MVLDYPERSADPETVRRIVLCSGRIYPDLVRSPRRAEAADLAVAHVERLYPFPGRQIRDLIGRYPNLDSVLWAREESRNMGARKFVLLKLREIVSARLRILDVLRPERSAPADFLGSPEPATIPGNDTPEAREIGYSAASRRSCVWWRHCGRYRGRSDRRDRRWSARGDRRRHRRCCPWRYCRQEGCRGCAAWRPVRGEAIHRGPE